MPAMGVIGGATIYYLQGKEGGREDKGYLKDICKKEIERIRGKKEKGITIW